MVAEPIQETLELVRGAQRGQQDAFNRLVERYYPRVLKIVRLRMGDRLRGRMESTDVLQETFAHAIANFDQFEMRSQSSLINWLAKLAENRLRSSAERWDAEKRNPDRETPLGSDETRSADPSLDADTLIPLDKAIRTEERGTIEACLTDLDEHYREVIILRNFVGLSFREVADETDRPTEGAARMLHAKAMIELAQRVKERLTGSDE